LFDIEEIKHDAEPVVVNNLFTYRISTRFQFSSGMHTGSR
jgi:hypothetical protein